MIGKIDSNVEKFILNVVLVLHLPNNILYGRRATVVDSVRVFG